MDQQDAAGILTSGGVLLLGTDTLPGFHARADRPEALARIRTLKGRGKAKPLVVLAASAVAAEDVAGPLDGRQRAYAARCWPGPFSLVLPARPLVPAEVTAGGATVAVRVPGDPALRALLAAAGWPLASTSVNRAGQEPATTLAEAVDRFGDLVDGVWSPDSRSLPDEAAVASAVVDLIAWPPRLLRPGSRPLPALDGLDAGPGGV